MNIGHNSGLPDFDTLPKSIQDIAESLGMGVVFALVEHFAGVELRIPHKLKPDHKLMALGEDYALMLCRFCPEDTIHVPMSLSGKRLKVQIDALQSRGFRRWQIALELNITQRHVRRLANTEPKESNQLDMFD
ncbi:MAG: hypothetical protein COB39_03400 [Marinosulfonomonas sp.]|nr:MAG: hypothetical protein COB39_03400 [Marinosulfonomonas sp.]